LLYGIINNTLSSDHELSNILPIDNNSNVDLSNGIILCKFFDILIPSIMDIRVMNTTFETKRDKVENWNLVINSGRAIGCRLNDIIIEEIVNGNVIHIFKIIWRIVKSSFELKIKRNKKILKQLLDYERIEDFALWPIDRILCRFVNKIINRARPSKQATSITQDFRDGELYFILLSELFGTTNCIDQYPNIQDRANYITNELNNKGLKVITLNGIQNGIYWQNFLLLASLYSCLK